MERRQFARLPIALDVLLVFNGNPVLRGSTVNIGPGGMFVSTKSLSYSCNTQVEIEFSTGFSAGSEHTYRIPVTIAHSSTDGLGLSFVESDESEYLLARTLLGMLCNESHTAMQSAMIGGSSYR